VKRILVALDGSPRAPLVLADAVRLAELIGAKLVLFRAIVVPPELPREVLAMSASALEHQLRRTARAELEQLAERLPHEMVEAYVVEFATAWDGICRASRTREVDLVVIGSRGYGALDRILGTTAAKVVNHIDRNVLVVRTPL
jgi:universal stress protein F